jgi:diacylglycerol O-acyltransferase
VAPEDCDRLSDDDARILGLESATITGHTLKLIVLEPGAGPLELDALRGAVAQRLAREPRATQSPTPNYATQRLELNEQ